MHNPGVDIVRYYGYLLVPQMVGQFVDVGSGGPGIIAGESLFEYPNPRESGAMTWKHSDRTGICFRQPCQNSGQLWSEIAGGPSPWVT